MHRSGLNRIAQGIRRNLTLGEAIQAKAESRKQQNLKKLDSLNPLGIKKAKRQAQPESGVFPSTVLPSIRKQPGQQNLEKRESTDLRVALSGNANQTRGSGF